MAAPSCSRILTHAPSLKTLAASFGAGGASAGAGAGGGGEAVNPLERLPGLAEALALVEAALSVGQHLPQMLLYR